MFFLAGLLFAVICGLIQLNWMDIVPYSTFGQQPDWLKGLNRVVGWLPWVAFAIVLVFRFIKGRRIRVGFYFLGTVAPVAVLIGWMVLSSPIADLVHRQKFDAEVWRSQEGAEHDSDWPPRLCMVDDLMSSGRLIGLTNNQVVELLGPPEDKGFPFGVSNCDIYYYLGPERGFIRIDSEWLYLKFGPDGKVSRQRIRRD